MSKNTQTNLSNEKKKVPYNVLRKGIVAGLLGVTLLAGGFMLTGCGEQGPAGTDGSTWYSGTTLYADQGKPGDFFFDTDDFNIYLKIDGGWTLISNIKGAAGEAGTTWHTGTIISGTGANITATVDKAKVGDIYFNNVTKDIYTCTAANTWAWLANINATESGSEANGTVWHTGNAVLGQGSTISATVAGAKVGDIYFNVESFDLYKCTAENVWSWIANTKGENGTSGSVWYNGPDVTAVTGKVGDYFFDTDDNSIYIRLEGGWNLVSTIQGAQGEAGSSWITGTAVTGTEAAISATVENARVGDLYFNTDTCDVYECIAENTWKWLASTKGETGAVWFNGTEIEGQTYAITAEIEGAKVGDMYLNVATCDIYKCESENTWRWIANTKGSQKIEWYSGTETPSRDIGKDGDFYFNTANHSIYQKVEGYWSYITTIKQDTENIPKQDWDEDGELKVLAIGNSYTDDTFEYAFEIAKGAGIEKVEMGKLIIPNSSLETHANNAKDDVAAYTYYSKNASSQSSSTTGYEDRYDWKNNGTYKISDAAKLTNWDYIIFQQVSSLSGDASSYTKTITEGETSVDVDFVQMFIDAVEPSAPRAKFAWNMTWAYPAGNSTLSSDYSNNQMNMYNAIVSAVKTKVANHDDISVVVPTGTAIQNARTSILKDRDFENSTGDAVWTRDYSHGHLTNGRDGSAIGADKVGAGSYTAGLTLVEALTGISMYKNNTFVPENDVTAMQARIAEDAAATANLKPYEVTTSYYSEVKEGYEQIDLKVLGKGFYNSSDTGTGDYGIPTYYIGSVPGYTSFPTSRARTYIMTDKFTRDELPNGTLLVATAGYRAEGWVFEEGAPLINTQATRGGSYSAGTVTIDDAWWNQPGDTGKVFTERAFNLGGSAIVTEANALSFARSLKIYVPVTNA